MENRSDRDAEADNTTGSSKESNAAQGTVSAPAGTRDIHLPFEALNPIALLQAGVGGDVVLFTHIGVENSDIRKLETNKYGYII